MLDFITKIFRRDESSRSLAKERLRLVLMSDRVALAPETFDLMKGEMLSVLQRYVDIDEHGIDVHFENAERRFMLYANISITNIKSSEQIEHERQRYAVGNGSHQSPAAPTRRRRRRRRQRAAVANGEDGTTAARPEAAQQASASNGHLPDLGVDAHPYAGGGNGSATSAPTTDESEPST
ncbi:MAG: cell division topological specificity factor MinE [Candidatus Eremiobacteraeota bacterium]|nr:cell division topological specificity factor MinE [Candidatus Eremiobacteraeota bacterium]